MVGTTGEGQEARGGGGTPTAWQTQGVGTPLAGGTRPEPYVEQDLLDDLRRVGGGVGDPATGAGPPVPVELRRLRARGSGIGECMLNACSPDERDTHPLSISATPGGSPPLRSRSRRTLSSGGLHRHHARGDEPSGRPLLQPARDEQSLSPGGPVGESLAAAVARIQFRRAPRLGPLIF